MKKEEAAKVYCSQSSFQNGYFLVVQFPKEIFRGHVEPGRHQFLIHDFKLIPKGRIPSGVLEEAHCFVDVTVSEKVSSVSLASAYFLGNGGGSADYKTKTLSGKELRACSIDVNDNTPPDFLGYRFHSFTCYTPGIDQRSTVGDFNKAMRGQGMIQVRQLPPRKSRERMSSLKMSVNSSR